MPKSATLADIAHDSGVSISTVSLVLRDKPGIPDETRERVLAAARALGYTPKRRTHSAAITSSAPRLYTLGLIIKSEPYLPPQANPFYSHVLAGIEEACRRSDINLLYATMPVDAHNVPVEMPRFLQDSPVDGILLVGAYVGETLHNLLQTKGAPVVLVDAYAATDRYDAVLSDNAHGAYQAVAHLIRRGHRHIALIGSHPNAYPSLQQRRDAYTHALADHGIHTTYFADSTLDRADLIRATTALLNQHTNITALFGVNDQAAIATLNAAESLGRRVPDELSIIGFDDIDMAQHVVPPLTTMHIDKIGMGRLAAQLLSDRIQFPESERITTLIQPRLVERASVANATARVKPRAVKSS